MCCAVASFFNLNAFCNDQVPIWVADQQRKAFVVPPADTVKEWGESWCEKWTRCLIDYLAACVLVASGWWPVVLVVGGQWC